MNILVIVGYCLKINSSANLCHLSYINGLLNLGHTVDLITVSDKNLATDSSIQLPTVRHLYEYQASFYEQYSCIHRSPVTIATEVVNQHVQQKKRSVKSQIKKAVRSMYGVYGTDIAWVYHAKKFRSKEMYDAVISLAYPPTSHRLAEYLIKKKRVITKRWLQVWEDPWYADLYGLTRSTQIKKEESRLLSVADKICYVSPLTLMYQKQFYAASAGKMFWKPLPSYYASAVPCVNKDRYVFGYFGDYYSSVRNLHPFYQVAVDQNLETYICGNSDCKFSSANSAHVFGRMSLQELHQYEDKTNVLVFVCNLKGGQIPGKIYQYSATEKYILFILDGTPTEKDTLKEYFEQFNRYIFCDNTVESISTAIQSIIDKRTQTVSAVPVEDFKPNNIMKSVLHEIMT